MKNKTRKTTSATEVKRSKASDKTDLVDKIIAFETGELSTKNTIELFAELVKTGQAWSLQGSYGRGATALIERGFIDKKGNILKYDIEE